MSEHDQTPAPVDEFDPNDFEDIKTPSDLGDAPDLEIVPVIIRRWIGRKFGRPARFWVAEMNGLDHDAYQQQMLKVEGTDIELQLKANTLRLLASTIVNPDTKKPVWESVSDAIETLGQFGQQGLDELATVARRLNGMDKASREKAAKKSEAA